METEPVSAEDFLGRLMVTVHPLREGASVSIPIFHFFLRRRSGESVLPRDVPAPSRGAPPEVLKRLAEEERVEVTDLGEEEKETQCSICIEDLSSKSHQNIIKMPACLHTFHQDCLFEWLGRRNSCPLCRSVPYDD